MATESLVTSRVDTQVPAYVDRAIERAHEATQDALGWLRAPAPADSRQQRRIRAHAYHAHREALQELAALEGHTLERELEDGTRVKLRVTARHLTPMRACLDGIYGLARRWVAVEGTLSPVLPITRTLGCVVASRYASTSPRTWTRWLPWLAAAGVVVYLPGAHNHPTLVGLPALYARDPDEASRALRRRRGAGYLSWSDDETARYGGWWRPIVDAMLEASSDAWARAHRFAELVTEWRARVARALAAKREAVLERMAKRRPAARRMVDLARQALGGGPPTTEDPPGATPPKKENPPEAQPFFDPGCGHNGHRIGPPITKLSPGSGQGQTSRTIRTPSAPSVVAPSAPTSTNTSTAPAKSRQGAPPPEPPAEKGGSSVYKDAFLRMLRISGTVGE